jgi:hypothetical protein
MTIGHTRPNLRVVYARIGAADVVLLGRVPKLWCRGPTLPLHVTLGSRGPCVSLSHPAGGHRYTSRGAGRKVPWVAMSKRTH